MSRFDARAWVIWLLAGGVLGITVRNPLYLALLLFISRLIHAICASPQAQGWRFPFWRVATLIMVFSTLFNLLTVHVGETVLLTLPLSWWLVGGPITAEAAVFGFLNGLSLVTLLSFFLAFNAVVPTSELARLTPGAFYELGLVMMIAVTYVPETARQFQRIREAQAIRGHRLRGVRDWRPIVLPLIVGGLERALNLAETMVARGYGSTEGRLPLRSRLVFLVGLLLVLAGALRVAWGGGDGWLLVMGGVAVVVGALLDLERRARRTHYRPRSWMAVDTLVASLALIPLVVLLLLSATGRVDLGYVPYPRLLWPPFSLSVGVLLLGLVAPAAVEVAR